MSNRTIELLQKYHVEHDAKAGNASQIAALQQAIAVLVFAEDAERAGVKVSDAALRMVEAAYSWAKGEDWTPPAP